MAERDELENRIIQLRKGILELAIMGVLYHDSHYGYSLVRHLTGDSSINLKEGTVYPILSRLSREGLVESHWRESRQGPPTGILTTSQQRDAVNMKPFAKNLSS